MQHRTIAVADGPLTVTDHGGEGPLFLLVHGLDGSSANWVDIVPGLLEHGHVVALDLPGFGLTPLDGRESSVRANGRRVRQAAGELGGDAILIGNSMGGPVVLEGALDHDGLRGVVLSAPALPRKGRGALIPGVAGLAAVTRIPAVGNLTPKHRSALTPSARAQSLMDLCMAPGHHASAAAMEAMVDVETARRQHPETPQAWRHAFTDLLWGIGRPTSWHARYDAVTAPVLLIDGLDDPIIATASVEATIARHPGWSRVGLPGVGHVPQMEAPDAFLEAVLAWLPATVS